jgi:DNA polymerase-3 subunit delta'
LNSTEPLPWQIDAWNDVARARAADRLPHALLVTGPAGLGKSHFANALARALLCERQGETACGECRPCRRAAAGNAPDWLTLNPPEDKKQIRIDQVRQLVEQMALTSHSGGRRVALIEPADAMNANAANSLLKTLEEPPSASMLILVTSRLWRLPATLRSRCRQVRLVPPTNARAAIDWLVREGLSVSDAQSLFELSGGRPLLALALNDSEMRERAVALGEWANEIVLGRRNPVAVAESLVKAPLGESLDLLMRWLGEVARARFGGGADRVARHLPPSRLFAALDRLYEAQRLRDTSVNPQLLLEAVLVPLAPGR